jgi:hypothetical protein
LKNSSSFLSSQEIRTKKAKRIIIFFMYVFF